MMVNTIFMMITNRHKFNLRPLVTEKKTCVVKTYFCNLKNVNSREIFSPATEIVKDLIRRKPELLEQQDDEFGWTP